MNLHFVDVLKPRQVYTEAGQLIDSYVVCAESPNEAVKAVKAMLERLRRDRPGTEIVHRAEENHEHPQLISANRHVTLGVARGLSVCSFFTETL